MKTTTWISTLAMMACACGSAPSPDAGTSITDARYFSVETIALSDEGQIYALGHDLVGNEYQIRVIDPTSKSVSRTILLANPHPAAHDLRLGAGGRIYFLEQDAGANLRVRLWCVDSTGGREFIVDQEATAEAGSYALSPDGKMVAFGDRIEPIYAHSGRQGGLEFFPHPMVFSSDATQLLDTNRGPRIVSVEPDGGQSIDATSSPVPIKGDDVLLARWDTVGFQALTKKDGQVYLEDLETHAATPLWRSDVSQYAWGDASHVFQETDSRCSEGGGGIGDAACARTAFTLYYRSLTDAGDVKDVAQVDARTWSEVVVLPDGKRFAWAVDGTLFVQSL